MRKSRLRPHAARWDKEHHFPKDVHQGLAALGAYGICVPEEFGGAQLTTSPWHWYSKKSRPVTAAPARHQCDQLPGQRHPHALWQRPAKKRDWLTPLAQGQMLGAFCLTEPHVGSDASALRTMAVKDGDEYVINGVKQFITSGKNGHVAIVIAVTDKGAGKRA